MGTDRVSVNGHGCAPLKLYLEEQILGQSCPVNFGLSTQNWVDLNINFQCYVKVQRSPGAGDTRL